VFAFIGVVFVIWIGFVIIKSVISGGVKGTLLRAAVTATEQGVPMHFAKACIENSDRMIRARRALANENPGFGTMDLYAQYAAVIISSYRIGQENERTQR
jgi:hypothetical protein